MRYALLLLAALALPCHADDWTREDSYRQATLTAFLVVDWAQTRWAIRRNEKTHYCSSGPSPCVLYEENNPLLGTHPSIGKVNNLIGASIIAHAAIAYTLPRGWREGWQYVWIGIETNAVYRNHEVGIRMTF